MLDLKTIKSQVLIVVDAIENIKDTSKWEAALEAAGTILLEGKSALTILGVAFTPAPGSGSHFTAAALDQACLPTEEKCERMRKCCEEAGHFTASPLPQVNWLGLLASLLQTLITQILTPATPPTPVPASS